MRQFTHSTLKGDKLAEAVVRLTTSTLLLIAAAFRHLRLVAKGLAPLGAVRARLLLAQLRQRLLQARHVQLQLGGRRLRRLAGRKAMSMRRSRKGSSAVASGNSRDERR